MTPQKNADQPMTESSRHAQINDILQQKKELRSCMRKTLKLFCESPLYEHFSKKAAELFLNSELYRRAPLVLAFVSLKTEIDTHSLIEKMMQDNKKIAIPLTSDTPENGQSMLFKTLRNDDPLEKQLISGNYGIEEPLPELEEVAPETLPAGTVILVPGMAFSMSGARLGKGKGYYDNYLARVPAYAILVGYAFQMQIVETVPCEPHDKPVKYLVTEERITHTACRN